MANQPSPPSSQPPPELPNDPKLSDTLAQYLRTFSLWCRHGFADKLSSSSSQPGVLLQATVNVPSNVNPNSYLLQVGQAGTYWSSPVAMGKGQPSSGAVGTPVQVNSTGIADGSNAVAGQIGEVISNANYTPVALTSTVVANIVSIALSAGDWDVCGEVWVSVGTGGAVLLTAGINGVSATLPTLAVNVSRAQIAAALLASNAQVLAMRTCRINLAAPSTQYLVLYANFPSGTTTAQGLITARRAR